MTRSSPSSVRYQLSTLQHKGYLHRDVGRPRTMEVRLPDHLALRPVRGVNGTAEPELYADGTDVGSGEDAQEG